LAELVVLRFAGFGARGAARPTTRAGGELPDIDEDVAVGVPRFRVFAQHAEPAYDRRPLVLRFGEHPARPGRSAVRRSEPFQQWPRALVEKAVRLVGHVDELGAAGEVIAPQPVESVLDGRAQLPDT